MFTLLLVAYVLIVAAGLRDSFVLAVSLLVLFLSRRGGWAFDIPPQVALLCRDLLLAQPEVSVMHSIAISASIANDGAEDKKCDRAIVSSRRDFREATLAVSLRSASAMCTHCIFAG